MSMAPDVMRQRLSSWALTAKDFGIFLFENYTSSQLFAGLGPKNQVKL